MALPVGAASFWNGEMRPVLPHTAPSMRQSSLGRKALAAIGRFRDARQMVEIMRTNDLVLIGAVEALLTSAGIGVFVADGYISALEGSIGAFQRRVLVLDEEEDAARELLTGAGWGAELRG